VEAEVSKWKWKWVSRSGSVLQWKWKCGGGKESCCDIDALFKNDAEIFIVCSMPPTSLSSAPQQAPAMLMPISLPGPVENMLH
jgi:hypothetical protein